MTDRHVSEFLDQFFRRAGMKRSLKRAMSVLLWPRVVGADVARFSSARALRDGILYVDVSDSETAMHLSLQRSRFLGEYKGRYGVNDVREIRFQVGRVPPPQPEKQTSAPPLPPADPAELAELAEHLRALALPEGVGRAALQAGAGWLALQAARRAQGWTPCPTCGALHDGAVRPPTQREEALQVAGRSDERTELARQLCAACSRYAHEGRVRDAAARLKVDPVFAPVGLSDDELQVARLLAARWLDQDLRELMPAAALRPAILPQLDQAARCRVALALGIEPSAVVAEDLYGFDPRLAQLLRRLPGGPTA